VRLLVVSQYFWPETFRVNDLVEGLVARGHEVTVLTGQPNYPEGCIYPEFKKDPARFATFKGARIERVPLLPRGGNAVRLALNYLSFALSGWFLGPGRLRGQTFDAVVIAQLSPVTAALPGIRIGKRLRIPVLMWVLDLWPESLSAVGVVKSPWILGMVGCIVRFIYQRCDRILVQSRAFVPNVERYGRAPDRIRYFPGWAEPIFLADLAQVEPAPEVQAFQDGFNLLFAGNIGDAQDFPTVLEALEIVRDVPGLRLLVLGDGRAAGSVRAEVERRGLEDRVFLLGRYPIERMPSFFRAADALLVSLRKEPIFAMTIPGKVQTNLATGIPMLALLDGEGARVVKEAEAGLVAPAGDAMALAQAIRDLVALPAQERAAMGARGKVYASQTFDREKLLEALEGWVRELLPSGASDVEKGERDGHDR
jgi:colanic acid biosynthesis glycosyl transferase WcaI